MLGRRRDAARRSAADRGAHQGRHVGRSAGEVPAAESRARLGDVGHRREVDVDAEAAEVAGGGGVDRPGVRCGADLGLPGCGPREGHGVHHPLDARGHVHAELHPPGGRRHG